MIAKLRGILDSTALSTCVIDVQGVGYLLSVSGRTLNRLPAIGEAVALFVETVFRAEHLELFGFFDEEERALFNLLLTVQGVGARVALALQSVLSPAEIIAAIATQDKTLLTRADGVGPKLAARLVMELKDKVGSLPQTFALGKASAHTVFAMTPADAIHEDALGVLIRLGYKRGEVLSAVAAVMKSNEAMSVENLVKGALQELTKGQRG